MTISQVRHQQILRLLTENSNLRVSELSQALGVSEATVRRDLNRLASSGSIQRKHGSAELVRVETPEPPIVMRAKEAILEKQRIGRAAAALIKEGESVFIGSGTTALEVARNLCGRKNLTVITNAQTVIALLANETGISLVSTGGLLRNSELSFLGYLTVQALSQLRPQKTIMGIRAVSIENGLTSDYLPEVTTDKAIIESGQEVILVADHSKFGKVAPAYIAPISVIHTLVTDDQTPEELITSFRDQGIHVAVC